MPIPPTDSLITLLARLNQNIMAVASATEEIGIWIEQRGSTDVAVRIEDRLEVIHSNADVITEALVELMASTQQ